MQSLKFALINFLSILYTQILEYLIILGSGKVVIIRRSINQAQLLKIIQTPSFLLVTLPPYAWFSPTHTPAPGIPIA